MQDFTNNQFYTVISSESNCEKIEQQKNFNFYKKNDLTNDLK